MRQISNFTKKHDAIYKPEKVEGCIFCNSAPVSLLELNTITGLMLVRQVGFFKNYVCRNCGKALYKQAQKHNLTKGWWSMSAFVLNPIYIIGNIITYKRFSNKINK